MIVNGTNGNDNGNKMLIGSIYADTINGLAGNDELYALGGDDIVVGGLGHDTINGGAGFDIVSYAYATSGVSVGLGQNGVGSATVSSADQDDLFNIEAIWGSNHHDYLFGNEFANSIAGRGGNDWIRGGAGGDNLTGGAGVDALDYYGSNAGVNVNLANNTASGGYASGDVISGFENVYGTEFGDLLTGNNAANHLWGGGGNDTLRGNGGADRLRGMAGADDLWGGAGADLFYVDEGESGPTAGLRDTIHDFSEAQGDRIDLSGFGHTSGGNWVFEFIGTSAFSGIRQVRAEVSGGDTYVTASLDGGVDMWLKLEGVHSLEANDFLL